jgi:hypothetical protein
MKLNKIIIKYNNMKKNKIHFVTFDNKLNKLNSKELLNFYNNINKNLIK